MNSAIPDPQFDDCFSMRFRSEEKEAFDSTKHFCKHDTARALAGDLLLLLFKTVLPCYAGLVLQFPSSLPNCAI